MALTLDDMLADKTRDDWRAQLYSAAQGRGFVFNRDGVGTGTLSLAGTPVGTYDVAIKVMGLPGGLVVQFQYSVDGGSTWSSTLTTDSAGAYALVALGIALQFLFTGYNPFIVGETYTFSLFSPALPVMSWQEGSIGRTQLDVDSMVLEEESAVVKGITAGGYTQTAKGGWADLLGKSQFDEERILGQRAVHTVVLTDAGAGGPYTIIPGQLTAKSDSGKLFTNSTGGTLTLSGTLSISFIAAQIGADYNVAPGTLRTLVTTIPGVTLNNPGPTSLTTQGRDDETDEAYMLRCREKWPTLASVTTDDVYDYWAKKISKNVTRTFARVSPSVAGQVDLFLAGPAGAVDSGTVTAVDDFVQERLVGLTEAVVTASATGHTVDVSGDVYIVNALLAIATAQIEANLEALANGGRNNLGEELPGVPIAGVLYAGQVVEQIQAATGVRNLDLSTLEFDGTPAVDVVLTVPQVLALTNSLNLVGV